MVMEKGVREIDRLPPAFVDKQLGPLITGLILLLLPGYAYFIAYGWELGRATFYGYSHQFIQISAPNILFTLTILVLCGFLIWVFFRPLSRIVSKAMLLRILAAMLLLLYLYNAKNKLIGAIALTVGILLAAIDEWLASRRTRPGRGFRAPSRSVLYLAPITAVLAFITAQQLGFLVASLGTSQYFIKGTDRVGLTLFGKNLVTGEYNAGAKKISPPYSVQEIGETPVTFEIRKVGRLRPATHP